MYWYPMMGAVSSVVFVQTFKYVVVEYLLRVRNVRREFITSYGKTPDFFS